MFVYLGLIVVIFLYDCLLKIWGKLNIARRRTIFLRGTFVLLWLLCALKKDTVGIDIAGYRRIYEMSALWPWFDYSQVYFEKGYYVFMQIFAKLGADFQIFNAVCYAIIYYPWYLFFKKYSKQPMLSVLIYICYQFFVFNMSGLRQGIALSVCLLAYICLRESKKYRVLKFCLLVMLAAMFHRSAIVFYIALGLLLIRPGTWTNLLFAAGCFLVVLFRPLIVYFLNGLGSYQTRVTMTLGGSFLMLLCFAIFSLFVDTTIRKKYQKWGLTLGLDFSPTYMMMCAVILNLALNGSIILRTASYTSCFLTISVPTALSVCDKQSRIILSFIFSLFLLLLFVHEVLIPNQLLIMPYKFFWN